MRNQFQPLLDAMDGVSYLVDAHGTILAAGQQGWQRFAEETDSRDLTVASVVGKSLFGCLDGGPVRKMYSDMHASVCSGRQSRIAFCYRCDGPSTKREMHMSISGVRDSGASLALFQSQVLAEGQRPRMGLFAYGRQAPASGLIRTPALVCSYCHAQGSPHSGRATGERKDSGERRMFAKRLEAMLPAVKLQKVRESHCA